MCAAAVLSPTPQLPVSCVFWRRWLQGWQPLHAAIVGTVMAILLLLWWFSSQHWQTQARQVDQAARMQQAGMAAIVAENLRQVVEKAQLAAAVAQQGLWGQRGWQQQLEQMLQRDRVFLRHALYSADGQHLAGAEISAALLHSLQAQQHACPQVRVLQPEAAPVIQPSHVLQVPLLLCLHGPDDVLQALLVLHMDMGYFLRLYQDMDLGSSGMLHLVAQDGSVVAALAGGGLLAQPVQQLTAVARLQERSGEINLALGAGDMRLAKFHRVADVPLTVVASREWAEIRAAQQEHVTGTRWLLAAVSLMAIMATIAVLRTLQRKQHLYEALARADHDKQTLIAQLKQEKQRALDLASSDYLTGLHNRRMFHELVSSHLALARRSRKHYALLYLDMDRFKQINDSFGHHVGDALLQAVAQRLRSILRSSDVIARMGGDEFAVLVTALERMEDVEALASKLVAALAAPYEGLDAAPIHTSPSMGIALFPRDGHDVEVLCRHADAAMYASKKAGRNRFTFYDRLPELDTERSLRLTRQLPQAIACEQLVLHFQPKVRLDDCSIDSFEALVRWQHPELGLIYPGDFVPLAEAHGHVEALGDWVMQACCRQIAAWRMQGLDLVPVAFNVSPLQLADSGFPVRLTTWLQHYGVRTSDIQIEITESCLVEPAGIAARVLAQLQHMGVRIALDDFGTGFSSLSQIRNLPINTIKLDKSFVNELRTSTEAGVLVTSIITLAHNLRMQVVAEGVELKDQLVYLKTAGCDVAQGYFLSRPVAAAQAEALLRQGVVQLS